MSYTNHTPAKPPATPKPIEQPSRKGMTASDLRRSTYTPQRPAGVHARELGLKRT